MTADKISWLSQWTPNCTIDQNSRSAKRSNDHNQIGSLKHAIVNKCYRSDTPEGTYPGPDDLGKANTWWALRRSSHFFKIFHVIL